MRPMELAENRVRSAPPVAEPGLRGETPFPLIAELLTQSCSVRPDVCRKFMRRTRNLRVPPRWSSTDWWRKLKPR